MKKQPVAVLRIEKGPHEGERIDVHEGASISFGRSLESDCFIPDNTVSRNHAEFIADDIRVSVRNLGSNGIIINDERVVHDAPVSLEHGALVEIGPCQLRVEMLHLERTFVLYETMIRPLNAMKTMFMPSTKRFSQGGNPAVGRGAKPSEKVPDGERVSFLDNYLQSSMSKVLLALGVLLLLIIIAGDLLGPDTPGAPTKSIPEGLHSDSTFVIQVPQVSTGAPIPPDSLALAKRLFIKAEKRFLDRALHDPNAYDSIQAWQRGITIIGRYTQRKQVPEYVSALTKSGEATRYLNEQFELWKKDVIIKTNQGNYRDANETLQKIIRSVPDIHNFAYGWAKRFELRLKTKL